MNTVCNTMLILIKYSSHQTREQYLKDINTISHTVFTTFKDLETGVKLYRDNIVRTVEFHSYLLSSINLPSKSVLLLFHENVFLGVGQQITLFGTLILLVQLNKFLKESKYVDN